MTFYCTCSSVQFFNPTYPGEFLHLNNQRAIKGPITITKIFSLKGPTKPPKGPILAPGPRYGQHCSVGIHNNLLFTIWTQTWTRSSSCVNWRQGRRRGSSRVPDITPAGPALRCSSSAAAERPMDRSRWARKWLTFWIMVNHLFVLLLWLVHAHILVITCTRTRTF